MSRFDDYVDSVLAGLTRDGFNLDPFRGAEVVEIARDNDFYEWIVYAEAGMQAKGMDIPLALRLHAYAIPSEASLEIARLEWEQHQAFLRDARFFDEQVCPNPQYAGKYVAVYEETVLDSDPDVSRLIARIRNREHGKYILGRALKEFVPTSEDAVM